MNERIALSVAIAAALLSAQAAQAQEAATAKGQQTVEEVTVTGSRIQRDGYSAPTPVTVATSVELTTTTPTTLADGLNKLPHSRCRAARRAACTTGHARTRTATC